MSKPVIEYPSYEKYGVFKCLGCKHYLSGDHFKCKENCPRTEKGTEQIVCRQEDIREEISKIEKEKQKLFKEYEDLETYMQFTRCPKNTTLYSEDCPSSCAYECKV